MTNNIRKKTLALTLILWTALLAPLATAGGLDPVPDLKPKIDRLLAARNMPRGSVGIKVVSLLDRRVLYELNPTKPFSPASTMKMITMAAALERLGPGFRWKTEVWHDGTIQ